jgi:hypothetical protein
LDSGSLQEAEKSSKGLKAFGKGKKLCKRQAQEETHLWRSRRADDLPRRFSNAAILDSGRTGRLAGTAKEAEIQVIFKAFAEFDATIGGGLHQMNSAAGRFGFEAKCAVCRTLIQTQSAVDTLIEFGQVQRRDSWMIAGLLFVVKVIHGSHLPVSSLRSGVSRFEP